MRRKSENKELLNKFFVLMKHITSKVPTVTVHGSQQNPARHTWTAPIPTSTQKTTDQDGSPLHLPVPAMLRRQKGTALSSPHHRRMRSLQDLPCRRCRAALCGSTAERTGLSCEVGPNHPEHRRIQSLRAGCSPRSVARSHQRIRNSGAQQSLL